MTFPARYSPSVSLNDCILYSISKLLYGRCGLKDFPFDLLTIFFGSFNYPTDLSITSSVLYVREESLRPPRSLMNCYMSPYRIDYIIIHKVDVHRFDPLGSTSRKGLVVTRSILLQLIKCVYKSV